MDESAKYKQMAYSNKKIQSMWVPEVGDFWYCACSNCIKSDSIWIIERTDYLAIQPNLDLTRYGDTTKSAVLDSQMGGFAAFWAEKYEAPKDDLGFVWLPRLDQLFSIAMNHLRYHFVHVNTEFYKWIGSEAQCHTPCSFPFMSMEQMAFAWVSGLLLD